MKSLKCIIATLVISMLVFIPNIDFVYSLEYNLSNKNSYLPFFKKKYNNFYTIEDRDYYFKDRKLQHGFFKINHDTYYAHKKHGYLMSGLQSIGNKLYYFDPQDYTMLKNSSVSISKLCFSFDKNGICNKITPLDNDDRTKLLYQCFKFLGTPYGTDKNQFRCSSFVSYVYSTIGINDLLNQKCHQQADTCLNLDAEVRLKDLKPGDLIFFNNYTCKYGSTCNRIKGIYHIHHVAIYVAPGTIIESTSNVCYGPAGVRITSFAPNHPNLSRCPILYVNLIDKKK